MDLLEEAARYRDAFAFADDTDDIGAGEAEEEDSYAAEETDAQADEGPGQDDASEKPVWLRTLDIALAEGYVLRTKANGWKLFCEELNVPPFLLWEIHPGFNRLQRALTLAEKAALVLEGFLRWLKRVRPKGEPELTAVPLTVEGVANETAEAFRHRLQWWGAESTIDSLSMPPNRGTETSRCHSTAV